MSTGPSIIYDKSAIQGLNSEEVLYLSAYFRANLVPILYIEVLADLAKPAPEGRTPEDVVRTIASKVSPVGLTPNVFHGTLCIGDLLGHAVKMANVPVRAGGQRITTSDGKAGVFFDQSPEEEALQRWDEGAFHKLEQDFAHAWRKQLEALNLEAIATSLRLNGKPKYSDLAAVKAAADKIAAGEGNRLGILRTALDVLGIPPAYHAAVFARWKSLGGPPLAQFAPYAHYVFTVEIFFYLGLASGQIAATRPSHRTDIAYLFYLPFCEVFTSCDRLHVTTAPLFLGANQVFVNGTELKRDLAEIIASLPRNEAGEMIGEQDRGYPPIERQSLLTDLYDRFRPGWRKFAANPIKITPELNAAIMKQMAPMLDAIKKLDEKKARDGGDKG